MRVKLLPVGWCVLAVLLCAAPCSADVISIFDPEPDVTSDVYSGDFLMVYGTLNLRAGAIVGGLWVQSGGTVNTYPGASVLEAMYVDPGGAVNIHGGGVAYGIWPFDGDPQAVVTVYGTYFEVDGAPYSADEFIPELGVGSVLTGLYENDDLIYLEFYGPVPIYLVRLVPGVVDVAIDIKPGSDTNPINLKSKGLVPVAVLSANGFVASTVDPQSVLLEGVVPSQEGVEPPPGVKPLRWTMEDVDGDGDKDMLFHFKTEDLAKVLTEDSTEATLTGETTEGTQIQGTDKVQIVPSKPKK